MQKLFFVLVSLTLLSCSNPELEPTIKKLEKENKELSEKKIDSMSIFKILENNRKRQEVYTFLDSVKIKDRNFYEILTQVIQEQPWTDNDEYEIIPSYESR